uniref:NET domain-containing protein n=1 Tax=Aegilops tauschii subsp. strangulata TaxID=200361 RepID=A0A453G8D6_AEGTS
GQAEAKGSALREARRGKRRIRSCACYLPPRIFGCIFALSEFRSEKLPSNHGSGSYEDGIAPPSVKKQKTVTVSTIDAYEESHGHIDSDIFAQLTRDIRLIEESGKTRQEAAKMFSDGLLRKLAKMEQGVYDLLDTVASKCRSMTTPEKIELGRRIRKLPETALDHMVEDDTTLWRLYYYVETALKAKQDRTVTPP